MFKVENLILGRDPSALDPGLITKNYLQILLNNQYKSNYKTF